MQTNWTKFFFIFCHIWFFLLCTLWVAAKYNPQVFTPKGFLDIFYPIFCFQQVFWLNESFSMSSFNNIYIFRRILFSWNLKNRAKIEKSAKIKNCPIFSFFFSFSLGQLMLLFGRMSELPDSSQYTVCDVDVFNNVIFVVIIR